MKRTETKPSTEEQLTMRPWPCLRMTGRTQPGQFVPAEEIGLEELADVLGRHVLEGAGLAVGAVVEQRVELAAGALEHLVDGGGDGGAVGKVEAQRLQPLAGEAVGVLLPAAGGEDAPAAVLLEGMGAVVADAGRTAGDQDCPLRRLHSAARWSRLRCRRDPVSAPITSRRLMSTILSSPNAPAAAGRWPRFPL